MLDSNVHNDSNEKGESVMGKVAELSNGQAQHFEQGIKYMYKIYKVTGIHPTEFKSMDQYYEAVATKIETESLHRELDSEEGTDSGRLKEILQNELKKRGELS